MAVLASVQRGEQAMVSGDYDTRLLNCDLVTGSCSGFVALSDEHTVRPILVQSEEACKTIPIRLNPSDREKGDGPSFQLGNLRFTIEDMLDRPTKCPVSLLVPFDTILARMLLKLQLMGFREDASRFAVAYCRFLQRQR